MRSNRLWIGATCGVALALGAVAAVDAGTQTAGAQADRRVHQASRVRARTFAAAVEQHVLNPRIDPGRQQAACGPA